MSFEKVKSFETGVNEDLGSSQFDIDRRLDPGMSKIDFNSGQIDIDKRIPVDLENNKLEVQDVDDVFCEKAELFSSKQDRIIFTPLDNGKAGEWSGERGESLFMPSDQDIKDALSKYGLEGIQYRNCIPDFSSIADTTVTIDYMTINRYGYGGNFQQADTAAAKRWSIERREERSNWSPREVADWRSEHGMSWHERSDMKTMDLVPADIHLCCSHSGGVFECRKRDGQEVQFDA